MRTGSATLPVARRLAGSDLLLQLEATVVRGVQLADDLVVVDTPQRQQHAAGVAHHEPVEPSQDATDEVVRDAIHAELREWGTRWGMDDLGEGTSRRPGAGLCDDPHGQCTVAAQGRTGPGR